MTLTFTNIQDGRYFWSPDRVSVVDRLGRMYVAYPGPVNAAMATPGTTGSIAQNLISARSTVRLTLRYDVPVGTDLSYVLISVGRAEYVVGGGSGWGCQSCLQQRSGHNAESGRDQLFPLRRLE